MAWLWSSFEEFRNNVDPVLIDHDGPLRAARMETLCEHHAKITKALIELEEAETKLRKMGFGDDPPSQDRSQLDGVHLFCEQAVWSGEGLLLYHSRLARTRAGYDFCHQKDIIKRENWDRYSSSKRIFREVAKLVESVSGLVAAYADMLTADDEYLPMEGDLPASALADFRLARDLLSIGLDEVGLLVAGRGLEGTLRHIAKDRRVVIGDKQKGVPASDASFHDLIETFGRLQWRRRGSRLLDKDAVALLHYLRSIRNAGAHPVIGQNRRKSSAREITKITVEMAAALWAEATEKGARLMSTKVAKDWR